MDNRISYKVGICGVSVNLGLTEREAVLGAVKISGLYDKLVSELRSHSLSGQELEILKILIADKQQAVLTDLLDDISDDLRDIRKTIEVMDIKKKKTLYDIARSHEIEGL